MGRTGLIIVALGSMVLLAGTDSVISKPDSIADGIEYGLKEPRPRTPGTVRIAEYNIENVFDHEDDPGLSGEFDDKDLGISPERARNIADAIRRIDADVLAVAEIESLQALEWFRDTYLGDMGYQYAASIDVSYFRGIEQGVLSRFEIVEARATPNASLENLNREGVGWRDIPPDAQDEMTFQRAPLIADLRTPDGYEFTLIVVHHKAGNFDWKRELEALKVVEWIKTIEAEHPSRNIIVTGDFNAAPWYKSLRVYLEAGLVDVMAYRTVSNEEGLQFKTHRSDRVLDYFLLNAPAFNEYVPASGFVLGTYNPPDSWNWREDPYPPQYASDHFPVAIDLVPKDRN